MLHIYKGNEEINFVMDEETGEEREIIVQKIVLDDEDLEMLEKFGHIETMRWEGIFKDDGSPAIGGEGNSDGIEEIGALYITKEFLENFTETVEREYLEYDAREEEEK